MVIGDGAMVLIFDLSSQLARVFQPVAPGAGKVNTALMGRPRAFSRRTQAIPTWGPMTKSAVERQSASQPDRAQTETVPAKSLGRPEIGSMMCRPCSEFPEDETDPADTRHVSIETFR